MDQQQSSFRGWARVEVMGHNTHIGHVTTEVYGMAAFFRVDTPALPEREYVLTSPAYITENGSQVWMRAGAKVRRMATPGSSVLVNSTSLYRMIPCTEEAAMIAIEETQRAELRLIELPPGKALAAGAEPDEELDELDGPDDPDDEEDPYEEDEDPFK